jgi:hypothetical protein
MFGERSAVRCYTIFFRRSLPICAHFTAPWRDILHIVSERNFVTWEFETSRFIVNVITKLFLNCMFPESKYECSIGRFKHNERRRNNCCLYVSNTPMSEQKRKTTKKQMTAGKNRTTYPPSYKKTLGSTVPPKGTRMFADYRGSSVSGRRWRTVIVFSHTLPFYTFAIISPICRLCHRLAPQSREPLTV